MQRKLLYTSIIALIAAGVGYSQVSGFLGWNNDTDDTTEAGTLGNRGSRSGNNITLDNGIKNSSGITLDNGIRNNATVNTGDN